MFRGTRYLSALGALLASFSPSLAATTPATYVVWQGQAVVTAAASACSTGIPERARIVAGTVIRTIVRPRLLESNGNDSRIAFNLNARGNFTLALAGGLTLSGVGTYAAYGVSTDGVLRTNVGGQYRAFALSPVSPTKSDTFLTLTGTIDNFMYITGCTVTFRAGYSLRP